MSCLVVVQCRADSRRLPQKAFYPMAGLPLLVFLLRRLKWGLENEDYRLVLATTERPTDDLVAAWGRAEGLEVVRGETDDVMARYMRCLERFPADTVVRVTADNPLTCPLMLCELVAQQRRNTLDYVDCPDLPHGTGVDAYAASALRHMEREARQADEREHLNLYILRHSVAFGLGRVQAPPPLARPDLRMTVDTREDWEQMRQIPDPRHPSPWSMTLHEAIARMDSLRTG